MSESLLENIHDDMVSHFSSCYGSLYCNTKQNLFGLETSE